MAEHLTPQEKIALITSNLQETLNPEIVEDVIIKQNRPLIIYWGTAITGRPHCGYFVPMLKIAEFLKAGCTVKILLADIHGILDNLKSPRELVKHRTDYYRFVITELLKAVNVPVEQLQFSKGSDHELTPDYVMDLLAGASLFKPAVFKKAAAEVVKNTEEAPLSGLIYPLMQTLDEEYLGVDAQFGGVDQRKIFALAKEVLPKLGYKERAHFMNPILPGLAGGKMSSSDPDSKIDLLDTEEVVRKKLNKAFTEPKKVEDNGLLSFVEYVLLPASALRREAPHFEVQRREGEPLVYHDIKKIHVDYEADILTPQLLKSAVASALVPLLQSIQAAFQASSEWQEIEKKAYPPPPLEEKKKKKQKDKGTGYPGVKKGVGNGRSGAEEGVDKLMAKMAIVAENNPPSS
ncbi:MAG: hypothetical protein M1820_005464 [Bogoriella megaspora]|nr:MAG: hypothetical protein M1820_005464 [Bogoriella megaspora]